MECRRRWLLYIIPCTALILFSRTSIALLLKITASNYSWKTGNHEHVLYIYSKTSIYLLRMCRLTNCTASELLVNFKTHLKTSPPAEYIASFSPLEKDGLPQFLLHQEDCLRVWLQPDHIYGILKFDSVIFVLTWKQIFAPLHLTFKSHLNNSSRWYWVKLCYRQVIFMLLDTLHSTKKISW